MPEPSAAPGPPVEVAAGVIEDQGRVLLARRPEGGVLGGFWEFPGGKRRPHESFEGCLVRELREEIEVDITVGPLIERVLYRYPHATVEIHFFRATVDRGLPRPDGCAEVRWVPLRDLPDYRVPPANEALIKRLAGTRFPGPNP